MFVIRDFHDLIRILEEHPEWRAELRRLLLTEELLELPHIVRESASKQEALWQEVGGMREWIEEIARAQLATQEVLKRLAEQIERVETHIERLAQQLAQQIERVETHIERLAQQMERVETHIERLAQQMERVETHIERLAQQMERVETHIERLAQQMERVETHIEHLAQQMERVETHIEHLAQQMERVETHIERLAQQMERVETHIERLAQQMERVETHIERLAQQMERVETHIQRLAQQMERVEIQIELLTGSLAKLEEWQRGEGGRREGERYERQVIRRAPSIFNGGYGGSPEEPTVREKLSRWLEKVYEEGVKVSEEVDPFLADLIWWKGEKVAVVEISLKANGEDIMRAKKRADFLKSLGIDAVPIIISKEWAIKETTEELARRENVEWLIGGAPSNGFLLFCSASRKSED